MRWPQESAITRRDDHLARTRRISVTIIGWATAASIALAVAFGFALPGHALLSGLTGNSGGSGGGGNGQIAPPQQVPGGGGGYQPVVTSGGS